MAKAFSVASWNIEHFGKINSKRKIDPIIAFAANQKADILAIYEVESKRVFRPVIEAMPKYQFFITEGRQMQEILIGIKKNKSAYITQKLEFKSGQSTLRPGVLVTVNVNNKYYPVLFLHLKSNADPKGFGLRHNMLRRAFDFQKALKKAARASAIASAQAAGLPAPTQFEPVNYIFLGDLNTMGMDYYPVRQFDIPGNAEIAEIRRFSRYRDMRILDKNAPATWSNGSASKYPPANLDHVVAAKHLQFKKFGGAEVDVRGWPKESTVIAQDQWINSYSDHALIYFEVQKV